MCCFIYKYKEVNNKQSRCSRNSTAVYSGMTVDYPPYPYTIDFSETSSQSPEHEHHSLRVAMVKTSGLSFVKSAQVLYDPNRQVRVTERAVQ